MAAKGIVLLVGVAAATACASLESSEPATKSASSALNASPAATAATSLSSGDERSYGASCALWDTGFSREVVISAFGYKGATATPTYLNTYNVYDPATPAWSAGATVSQTVLGVTTNATAAAYVAAVTGPELSGGNPNTCYFAGGASGSLASPTLYKQVWRARIASGVVTWTKMTDMNVARAKFLLSWGGTSTQKLIAAGGGLEGTGLTDTIETYNLTNTWALDGSNFLNQAVGGFGSVKLSDTKFVIAGGDIGSGSVSEHINAIKVDASGVVDSVGDIKNGNATLIAGRKDNIVVPSGKTGLGGTDRSEIMVAMGRSNATTLVTTATNVVIEWDSSPPAYVSTSSGTAAPTAAAFPTIVDAYVSPKTAASNAGYIVVSGVNSAATQVSVNTIQKWNPDTSGGSWGTSTTFPDQNRTGVNAVYVKDIDFAIVSGGTDRYPSSTSSNDYLHTTQVR